MIFQDFIPCLHPEESVEYDYEILLNTDIGRWDFYIDGILEDTSHHMSVWIGKKCNEVKWGGEIYGHETDMPGKKLNNMKCKFTNCEYKIDFNYFSADFGSGGTNWESDDNYEWGIDKHLDGKSFDIWDVKPLQ